MTSNDGRDHGRQTEEHLRTTRPHDSHVRIAVQRRFMRPQCSVLATMQLPQQQLLPQQLLLLLLLAPCCTANRSLPLGELRCRVRGASGRSLARAPPLSALSAATRLLRPLFARSLTLCQRRVTDGHTASTCKSDVISKSSCNCSNRQRKAFRKSSLSKPKSPRCPIQFRLDSTAGVFYSATISVTTFRALGV